MSTPPAPPGTRWHPVSELPDDGRVLTAIVDGRSVAMTRCGGKLGALANHCPHQGGPLGEGSIENGLLRCPWHGYDYDPITGTPPGGIQRRTDCHRAQDLVLDVEPLAFGALRLVSPDGRVTHFPRAMARVRTVDGRTGLGWIEWNHNQP